MRILILAAGISDFANWMIGNSCGLVSGSPPHNVIQGRRLPNLIADYSLDAVIRKMRITNAGFPLTKFQEQSNFIESELGIFIDHMKESRETRTVEIIYSHFAMPAEIVYSTELSARNCDFLVGQSRANILGARFDDTPHLLVAGQTGGGKSTFLRQLIVHITLNEPKTRFLLIDLKGGLEFSIFEERRQFNVVPNVLVATEELKGMSALLDHRMSLLKSTKSKDFLAYNKMAKEKSAMPLFRQVLVIDEAAEMFLAGHHANSKDIQQARNILSKIARQGRAIGIHLVIATQRPDSKSLDPQVKANLTGVICFQMMNDASSIAVLGNGRATDLPRVPGRAIWKSGMDMVEVQTPYLSIDQALSLLGPPDDIRPSDEEIDVTPKPFGPQPNAITRTTVYQQTDI